MVKKILIPMPCVEGKSYQGITQRDAVNDYCVESMSLYSVWQRTYIQEPHKETQEENC